MSEQSNRVALVTGASRGIGRAVAVALARAGMHVLLNFRSRQADAEATLQLVEGAGGSGELCPFDVADAVASAQAIESALKRHPRIDVLVNNAGVRQDALMVFMQREQWSKVIDTDLNSFFHVTQPIVKAMVLNRWGRIVTVASTAGQTGVPGQANYSAAKAGLIGASRSLACEVAKRGVTVNVVAPGFTETEMVEGLPAEQMVAHIPAGRLGRPEEMAAAVAFLCSEPASYITGTVLNVNGGVYT